MKNLQKNRHLKRVILILFIEMMLTDLSNTQNKA